MNKNSSSTPRVVRTGQKTSNKKNGKKPVTPAKRVTKNILATVGKILLTTVLVLTITGCIVGTALTIYVVEFIDAEPTIDLTTLNLSYTAVIYGKDKEGNDVEVESINRQENRIWADLEEIPKYLQDAVVYTEDERFNQHNGVDFKRTFGAFAKMILHPDEKGFGGSTISQQLIKNINGDITNRTIDVKIKEIIGAMNLERHFTKPKILESYLNYISLGGNNISGVQAGAKYYFNKDVSELSLLECTSIAVISKNPSNYNPITKPANNKTRRNHALDKMLEFGKITQEEYDKNYDADLVLPSDKDKDNIKDEDKKEVTPIKKVQSYFVDSVIEEVIANLQTEKNWSYEHAQQMLYTGGYRVYTTMEIEKQKILEDYFANPDNFKFKDKENQLQAYMSIMNYDGNIVATVGGIGEKKGDRVLNRAMVSKRSPGSTIKPLAVYAPSFDYDFINWSSVMEDSAVQKVTDAKGVERDWPTNYNKKYDGNMTIIDALRVSKNTIPVRLVNALTPQTCFDFVYDKLQMKSLIPTGSINNVNPASLALGDCGVTLTELMGGYQIFGNGGYFIEPAMYTQVKDADGKVILDTSSRKKERVISSQTAYIMNRGLWNVVNTANGSGTQAKLSNWEVIGKTGTSSEAKDYTFMGLTSSYIATIRYGYDDNKIALKDRLIGVNHKVAWKNVMEKVLKGSPASKFELDDTGVVALEFCAQTGLLAHSGCPTKLTGYYKETNLPASCSLHAASGGTTTTTPDETETQPLE